MAKVKKSDQKKTNNGANVAYEAELWQMADALRGSMDAAEYKHVVLGLIFLKYISDAFEEQHAKLEADRAQGADPEDPDEYRALNIFWVPPEARWSHLKAQGKQPAIAQLLGTLDDKIELNRRMNETLEAMAQAIFKSWFVESIANGLPRDWRVSTVGEVCEFTYGKSLKEEMRHPGWIPVYGSNGQVGWHDEALVKGPGVVVGRKGNPGIVTWAATDFFPIDTAFYVVPKGECRSFYFLFYALCAQDLASLGADSAVPGLNRNLAYMSQQVIPPLDVLDAFDKAVSPLFDLIHHNAEESHTLVAVRNALLPKLISGDLRVRDAEYIVGRLA